MANLSQEIWEDPNYQKQPYTKKLFKHDGNEYYWELGTSEILIKYNEIEDAIEIKHTGNSRIDLDVNYIIDMIQILEQLIK